MAEHLDKAQYEALQQSLSDGTAELVFTRTFARQFYLRVGAGSIAEETGESALGQKLVLILLLSISVLLIVAALALLIQQFGWAGIFAAPLVGILWTICIGFTTEMGGAVTTLGILVLATALGYTLPFSFGAPVFAFGASVVFFRTAHIFAYHFLYELLSRSFEAYSNLHEHLEIERTN